MGERKSILKNKCYDCKHTYLMGSGMYAPIIAMYEKIEEEEVANTILYYPYFDKNDHFIEIHPVILCR